MWGLGLRVWASGLGLRLWASELWRNGLGLRVWGLRFRAWASRFGLGFRVWGVGFEVWVAYPFERRGDRERERQTDREREREIERERERAHPFKVRGRVELADLVVQLVLERFSSLNPEFSILNPQPSASEPQASSLASTLKPQASTFSTQECGARTPSRCGGESSWLIWWCGWCWSVQAPAWGLRVEG